MAKIPKLRHGYVFSHLAEPPHDAQGLTAPVNEIAPESPVGGVQFDLLSRPPKLAKIGEPEHGEHEFFDYNQRSKEYERIRKAFYAYLTSDGQAELDMVLDRDSRRRHFEDVKPIKQLEENGRYAYRRDNFRTYKRKGMLLRKWT